MDVGQADARRTLEGARGFLETSVDAPAFIGQGQRVLSRAALLLYADFAHRRGLSAPPWSPEGLAKNSSRGGAFAGAHHLAAII
jgi:hypothetical protein